MLLTAIVSALSSTAPAADLPRIMSMNVCTDQLVLLLAETEQIVSLSDLSLDPSLSYLHAEAAPYPKNSGRAEEVFLARPDLVVTGTFSLHNTTSLLETLDFAVEEFAYDQSVDTIPGEIRRMGALIGQDARAETIASAYERDLADLRARQCTMKPTAIAYEQNGVVLGEGTLADSVIDAAGFTNLATELGYSAMTPLPLEHLVSHQPDIVVVSEPMTDAPALADQIAHHPALRALETSRIGAFVPRGAWACGGPFVIEAVRALTELREEIASCDPAR
ncbi:ABC transporter substrate-binding protein [Mesorhizobium sp. YIM 152430]|uniref:ABC transporter substrate-binding protein n=1 Tax=Mesorhizobium sp. YIM 152430 TaxID=3031761 RepID=UPI0023DA2BEB|nr:ABC transporter substrate-binding protein [Mesorhizobium sp. YIM 152430]MDF1598447.1 ABC transporter substrate-binding protein [Mesorhizobium sp. YIM 152430]